MQQNFEEGIETSEYGRVLPVVLPANQSGRNICLDCFPGG